MEKQIEIFKRLQNTSSRLGKESILRENKDNDFFQECLNFLLNPFIITGIDVKKWDKVKEDAQAPHDEDLKKEFLLMLFHVKSNPSGKLSTVRVMKMWCNGLSDEIQEFTRAMVTKSLKLGVDAKTVNKCIPELIPVFNVMLGTPIDQCKLKRDEWISISRKLNGTRCAFVGNKLFTRQGKEYRGLEHIVNDLVTMGYGNKMFIDGELLYKNDDGRLSDSDSFQKGTGIAMSKEGDKSQLKLVVFDIFPLQEFYQGKSTETYLDRKKYLCKLRDRIREFGIMNVSVVPIVYQGTNHERIEHWLNYAESHDWEGIMLNLDSIYECKRVKTLIKVKKFFSCDIRCVGVEEGTGRNEGTLGALVCEYKGFKVNVGTGFSDEKRKEIWTNPNSVIGRIVSVKYKEETKNKNGSLSIQFPVFETVRFDKDEESYN